MTKMKEYLKGENGKPSSTRLFSYYILWLFIVMNIIIFTSVLFGNAPTMELNTLLLIVILDFILLIAIFVPKQLGKIEEIRKIIELAKTGVTETESEEKTE